MGSHDTELPLKPGSAYPGACEDSRSEVRGKGAHEAGRLEGLKALCPQP